MVIVLI
ncbi:hypothetical protein BLA29_007268 [Euroglyphus maynei]|nr:hypothetical protein BLA29_007268 [Euroglyphus maynei]